MSFVVPSTEDYAKVMGAVGNSSGFSPACGGGCPCRCVVCNSCVSCNSPFETSDILRWD